MNEVIATVPTPNRRQALRKWVLRLALILTLLVPLTFALGAIGAKFGFWSWQFGLGFMSRKLAVWLIGLAFAMGVIGLLMGLLFKPRKGLFVAALAILIPTIAMVQLMGVKKKAGELPLIHDITTDTQNPPTFSAAILSERAKTPDVNTVDYVGKRDLREKKLVSVLQTRAYPDVRPLILSDDPDVVFGEAKLAAKQMGWEIVAEDVASGKIEATATTFWYGFKDDIVIRIRPSEGGGSVLDVRSVSRVGASDLGANAQRISTFLSLMKVG